MNTPSTSYIRIPRNLILAVIGIAAIGLLGFIGYKTVVTKPQYVTVRVKGSPGNWWWVTPRPPDWLVRSVHEGDKEYNTLNKPIAEVTHVDIYDAGGSTKDIYLDVKLTVSKNPNTNKYRYKGESLEVGGPISLSLNNTFFPGIVTRIGDGDDTQPAQYKILKVKLYDRWPWEFDALKVGEKMYSGTSTPIAEILDKKIQLAEKEAVTADGRIVQAFSAVKSDFIVTLKIRTQTVNGELIFREEQYLKVGNYIWIQFPSSNISGGHILSIDDPT
jgi:hypothetical protein